jgi:hypothetical protein
MAPATIRSALGVAESSRPNYLVHVFLIEVVRSRDHPASKHFKLDGILRTYLVSNQCPLSASCPTLLLEASTTSLSPSAARRPLPRQHPLWV